MLQGCFRKNPTKKKIFKQQKNHFNPLLLQPVAKSGTAKHGSSIVKTPDVAKLADALDLGSSGVIHVGSTPIIRTFRKLTS